MFEWEAKDLKPGDEFTIDQGETWHRVSGGELTGVGDYYEDGGECVSVPLSDGWMCMILGATQKVMIR